MDKSEVAFRLEELRDNILDAISEAIRIIPEGITKERAKCYWYAHIKTAATKTHEFLGGSLVTMDDTIAELEEDEEG